MKAMDARNVFNIIDDCRRKLEDLPEVEVDRNKYISIEYLHKALVDAMYNGSLNSCTMSIYHKIIADWRDAK